MELTASSVQRLNRAVTSAPVASRPPFTFLQPNAKSADLIEKLMHFASGICSAQSAVFYWVDSDSRMVDHQTLNVAENQWQNYIASAVLKDPLRISRLKAEGHQVVALSNEINRPAGIDREYLSYISSIGVGDEIDFVFWQDNMPFACFAMIRSPNAPAFSVETHDWYAMREYFQSSLASHWRARSMKIEKALTTRFQLKPRELEVAQLICEGKSNHEISAILEISIATVKVHVVSILNKLGVDSRLSIACVINSLQF